MSQYYAKISFDDIEGLNDFGYNDYHGYIDGLSRINIFVGPNNCGKSRFLRGLFKSSEYSFDPNDLSGGELESIAKEIDLMILTTNEHIRQCSGNENDGIKNLPPNILSIFQHWPCLVFDHKEKLAEGTLFENFIKRLQIVADVQDGRQFPQINELKSKAKAALDKHSNHSIEIGKEKRVYIPILRGLRVITNNFNNASSGDFYKTRTAADYEMKDNSSQYIIFTGQTLYQEMKTMLLGSEERRQAHQRYEKFLSDKFFNGKKVLLIPREKAPDESLEANFFDMVWVSVEGEERERPICQLGDGIQSVILMTYLPFVTSERALFFIEEPDAFLHPGMQRKLLEVLSCHDSFSKHQFFFTTHSNHILDMTLDYRDMSTYLLRRKENHSKISLVGHCDRIVLSELGAKSSSIFLSNASIWVEGVTDRRYIRAYLKSYLTNSDSIGVIQEDTHFSFVEFAGSNIDHWDFSDDSDDLLIDATKICAESFIVLDGDNSDKSDRMTNIEKMFPEENRHLFSGKEIENSLPADVVKYVVKTMIESAQSRSLTKREKEKAIEKLDLIKSENYMAKKEGMGKYLDSTLEISYFEKKKGNSGTLEQKDRFCDHVVEYIESHSSIELTDDAEKLCEKVLNFVGKANA